MRARGLIVMLLVVGAAIVAPACGSADSTHADSSGSPLAVPATTVDATEGQAARGDRSIAPITTDQTATAVMIAVVDGTATYAAPVPEPIATHERDAAEDIAGYR